LLIVLGTSPCPALDFYFSTSDTVDQAVLEAFDLVILDPGSNTNLQRLKERGVRAYAYLSVVEVAPDAPYREQVRSQGIPILGQNEIWRSDLMEITDAKWPEFVRLKLAAEIAQKGFDGFFLDTVESVELLAAKQPARAQEFRDALTGLIRALKAQYPDKGLILNRGFKVWAGLREVIEGVLIESVFQTFDGQTKQFKAVDKESTEALLATAREIKAAGLNVFVIDYVDPADLSLAEATGRRITEGGFHALVTTPELEGRCLAPLREEPRRILVLYGSVEAALRLAVRWPADSVVAQYVQMPLEWLGYEVEYLNLTKQALPTELADKYAGVLFDRYVEVGLARETALVDWLVAQKNRGVKLVFFGTLPIKQPQQLERLVRAFALGGTAQQVDGLTNVTARVTAKPMNYEGSLVLLDTLFLDLRAPPQSEVLMSVQGVTKASQQYQFDAVSVTPWGGLALDPMCCSGDLILPNIGCWTR
jgi:hypothetical protein